MTAGIARRAAGFTLTELVIVMILATILAAFAAARINTQDFDAEGFANEAIAMVRYAQKTAISQHRTVAVVITKATPGSIRLCYTNIACGGGDLRDPPTGAVFTRNSKSNIAVGGTISNFTFSPLGKPSASGTITVSGGGVARTITIEPETGYVH
jgi:MSHA pilin protein MshC